MISWVVRLVGAGIMLQTLYFKFSGAEESVYIFSTLGMEPWGRIGVGIGELVASILLIWQRTRVYGALMAVGLMGGALMFHFTTLGISVQGDGGKLFILACLVFFASILEIFLHFGDLKSLLLRISPVYESYRKR